MAQEPHLLVELDQYLKAGVHIGTKFRTKYMSNFIYKIRSDGLAVLNLQKIDERIKIAALFLSHYEPSDILVIGRRENGWKAIKAFSKATGIRGVTGRYPPGLLTNSALKYFTECKIMLVTDPWPDKNAVKDAAQLGVPILAICDTNNESNYVDFVIPCNNKGKKSLGLFFYILAREYLKSRKTITNDTEFTCTIDDFTEE